ncbi:DUF3570 domain-containing protein [Usitatibacter palustris]|uniref:DUF3570 domain-containing protein n=1 Tax=Usitatibacter palustris TaxID=2732487 RepID=A0A6M4H538_9PROT|nr:DUF3570 domain-containing protein [Usitatibacter palustris]QJR14716.1 hypothetical protein DSM104440_01526 [Usitatibacter palustris]
MAATKQDGGALAALMKAALALPVLAVPMRSGAAETGEIGFSVLGYKERDLMKITEPVLWTRFSFAETWEFRASILMDIITGASPRVVSNQGGTPVQTITGASITDRRKGADAKLTKRLGDFTFSASRTISDEVDYDSRAFGLEATWDLNQKLTTLTAGYGKANDRVGSRDNPQLHERRDTKEYLIGVTQVLSPLAIVQSSLQFSRGDGYYNDPYKITFTFPPPGSEGIPQLAADVRPGSRDSLAWLTRYRQHVPASKGTLQAEYRFFRDDWGIRAHTLEAAWEQEINEAWSVRPALRYYTQSAADFYSPVIPTPRPAVLSSDQRLSAFGGLSPSVRGIWRHDSGVLVEGTVGYYYNAKDLRLGGDGSSAFNTLRAWYVFGSIIKEF